MAMPTLRNGMAQLICTTLTQDLDTGNLIIESRMELTTIMMEDISQVDLSLIT